MAAEKATREKMKAFWNTQAKNADNAEMMLDINADAIGLQEIPEVLSFLPDLSGKRVLELAGGIGRFTGHLAERARHVTTVDFVEKYVAKNREKHQSYTNIAYITDDVMNLSFEKDSFDVLFTNWILMYLDDDEIKRLLQRLLHWLTEDAYLFFRESCFIPSGNFNLQCQNPSFYRIPTQYNHLFHGASISGGDKQNGCHLEIVFARHLLALIQIKDNRGTLCWLLQKCKGGLRSGNQSKTSGQSKDGVAVVDAGPEKGMTVKDLQQREHNHIMMFGLRPGQTVLHVGCGDGHLVFHMAKKYGVRVHGIDPSFELIEAAWTKKGRECRGAKVCFEIGSITDRQFPAGFLDAIYTPGGLAKVGDRTPVLARFKDWLKPDGKLMLVNDVTSENLTIQRQMEDFKKVFPPGLKITLHGEDRHQLSWVLAEKTA